MPTAVLAFATLAPIRINNDSGVNYDIYKANIL